MAPNFFMASIIAFSLDSLFHGRLIFYGGEIVVLSCSPDRSTSLDLGIQLILPQGAFYLQQVRLFLHVSIVRPSPTKLRLNKTWLQ